MTEDWTDPTRMTKVRPVWITFQYYKFSIVAVFAVILLKSYRTVVQTGCSRSASSSIRRSRNEIVSTRENAATVYSSGSNSNKIAQTTNQQNNGNNNDDDDNNKTTTKEPTCSVRSQKSRPLAFISAAAASCWQFWLWFLFGSFGCWLFWLFFTHFGSIVSFGFVVLLICCC